MDQHREQLLDIYNAALNAVHGRRVLSEYLVKNHMVNSIYLIAAGKAAVAMAQGAVDQLNPQIQRGFVVGPEGESLLDDPRIVQCHGDHPLPGENSLAAGRGLVQFISSLPDDAFILALISGGASAMVELLPDVLDLPHLRAINQWLLESGLSIAEINDVRKRISSIKGGKLARWLGQRQCLCLLMSDVQEDDPTVIGSGLLFANENKKPFQLPDTMPDHLQQLCRQAQYQVNSCAQGNADVKWEVVANNAMSLQAARTRAESLGYRCQIHDDYLTGEAQQRGTEIATYINKHPGILHIWGGETTVTLPDEPGSGGRCQMLALSAAALLEKQSSAYLLACGSDGRDGPTLYAGALVDQGTLTRIARGHLDAQRCLVSADAGTCLDVSGDLLPARYTGTNVADIVLGYCASESAI